MTIQLTVDDLSTPHGLTRAELMTSQEVAELVGVPVSTVREWGRNGTLPRVKLGRHVRCATSGVTWRRPSWAPRSAVTGTVRRDVEDVASVQICRSRSR